VTDGEAGDQDRHFPEPPRDHDQQQQKRDVIPAAQDVLDAETQVAPNPPRSCCAPGRIDGGLRGHRRQHDIDRLSTEDRSEVHVVGERREQLAVEAPRRGTATDAPFDAEPAAFSREPGRARRNRFAGAGLGFEEELGLKIREHPGAGVGSGRRILNDRERGELEPANLDLGDGPVIDQGPLRIRDTLLVCERGRGNQQAEEQSREREALHGAASTRMSVRWRATSRNSRTAVSLRSRR